MFSIASARKCSRAPRSVILSGECSSEVETAQSIEDCASNLEFRVGLQLDSLRGVVAINGGDEADHASRDQVIETDGAGQALACAPRDQFYLRQVLEDCGFARRSAEERCLIHSFALCH